MAKTARKGVCEYTKRAHEITGHNLPTIIDEPGVYLLRNGMMATIHSADTQRSTFFCKGHIQRVLVSGRIRQDFNIWQPNGRFVSLGEHPHDIVKKVKSAIT